MYSAHFLDHTVYAAHTNYQQLPTNTIYWYGEIKMNTVAKST